VLDRAEDFARKAAANFKGIGGKPSSVAKVIWSRFSLTGDEYADHAGKSFRKFTEGYNAGVKYYFDKARGKS
jgi:hypothetical protein